MSSTPARIAAALALAATVVAPAAASGTTASHATVASASSRFGRILVDARGRSLYLFERDRTSASTCYGACASAWPPLTTTAKPAAVRGALARRLGTTRRRDGVLQVTYRGHPLYLFVGDRRAGQTTGQDLDQFGAEWYVLSPAGVKVEHRAS